MSQYPKLEGRFLQVGGCSFAFDPTRPAGQRVDRRFVRIGDQYMEGRARYRMVCKSYMCAGKDGYDMLTNQKILVSSCPGCLIHDWRSFGKRSIFSKHQLNHFSLVKFDFPTLFRLLQFLDFLSIQHIGILLVRVGNHPAVPWMGNWDMLCNSTLPLKMDRHSRPQVKSL